MRNWAISMAVGLLVSLLLMSVPLIKLTQPKAHLEWHWALGLAVSGLVGLIRLFQELRQVLGRRVLLFARIPVNPLGGSVRLENIGGPCNVALFLPGGFTRLHGQILTRTHSASGVHEFVRTVERVKMYYLFGHWLSRRFPFLKVELWHRSAGRDRSPIIIHIPVWEPIALIAIHFQLAATFSESKLNARYPVHEEEVLRCVVSENRNMLL
jgi:hypothetical protein